MQVKIILAPGMRELLAQLAVAIPEDGRNNIIFAEDRLTLEAERAVVSRSGGTFLTSVTTFARFLRGEYTGRVLSKQGSVITVGALAAANAERLGCFRKNPSGCADQLYETIAQLRAALVTPAMLQEAIPEADPVLAAKLKDIALIYEEYLKFLEGGYLDESGVLSLLPVAMEKSDKIRNANVFFVGFSSFTKQAAAGIRAAISAADSVTGIFIGGKNELYTNEAAEAFEKYCRECGADVARTYLAGSSGAVAEALRGALFDPEALRRPGLETDAVTIFEASGEDDELSFIAAMIKNEVYGKGVRFRDISLLLPDLSAYAVKLEKVFAEYKIPYFADVKKSALVHPVCRLALDYCQLLAEGFAAEDSLRFVGNLFFEPDASRRDLYSNYLLQFANFRGGLRRPLKEEAFSEKDKDNFVILQTLYERVRKIFALATVRAEGGRFAAAIRTMLDLAAAERVQTEYVNQLSSAGYAEESKFFGKGLESLLRVLEEIELLTGGVSLSIGEFSDLLRAGLKSLEISLIPQFTDAVFVGSLADSKKMPGKVLFAAALTSDVPAAGADTALISDRDIDRLRTLRVEIQPKIREVNARARENAALAISSFTERLYLSYPLSQGGKECKKSELFDYVFAALRRKGDKPLSVLTRGGIERWERENAAGYARYLSCAASERVPALKELLLRADRFRRGAADFTAHSGLYFALKERGEAPQNWIEPCESTQNFIPLAAELLFRGKREISPTLVEGYFACPYKNFSERGLRLAPRNEGAVKPLDTGDFMHAVLQRTAERLSAMRSETQCVQFARQEAERLLANPPFCYLKDTAAGRFTTDALLREAGVIAAELYRQIADSAYTVWGAEKTFGGRDKDFAGITLLSDEQEIRLAGKIDRIDRSGEYVRVVDYKTGSTVEADAESYYTGRKLQLQLYMSAVSAYGKPAGAYYFPARIAYARKGEEYPFRMTGFSLADEEVARLSDNAMQPGGKSRYVNVTLGKKADKVMNADDFEAFIDYSRLAARGCAREIQKGCIAPSPYANVCDYCAYGGVCGADRKRTARQEESAVKCAEIARIVKKRRGEL